MSKQQREVNRRERAAAIQKEAASKERNRRLLITLAIVVVLSAVVAGFVIFSGGGDSTTAAPVAVPAKASGQALVVGSNDKAKYKVVVYEDFLCPYCRQFETSSRDFLRIEAAQGTVQVEYRPFTTGAGGYSADALQAWGGVLAAGTPKQALAFHDVLFDRQPASGSPTPSELVTWAEDNGIHDKAVQAAMAQPGDALAAAAGQAARQDGATRPPFVVLDGKPLSADSPTALADALQRRILELEH